MTGDVRWIRARIDTVGSESLVVFYMFLYLYIYRGQLQIEQTRGDSGLE